MSFFHAPADAGVVDFGTASTTATKEATTTAQAASSSLTPGALTRRACLLAPALAALAAPAEVIAGPRQTPAPTNPTTHKTQKTQTTQWACAWGAAQRDLAQMPQAPGASHAAPRIVRDQTLRLCVQPTLDGRHWRVQLVNRWALQPVEIAQASLAVAAGDADGARESHAANIASASLQALHFGGLPHRRLAPGEVVWSDPVSLQAGAGQTLTLSLYVRKPFTLAAGYPALAGSGAAWLMPGNQCMAPQARAAKTLDWAPLLCGLDVLAQRGTRVLVAFGDSLTDGGGGGAGASAAQAWHSYPAHLGARWRSQRPPVAVINAGLGGNRLLKDGVGQSALKRFGRDVLQRSGVTHTLILIGINDIGYGSFNGQRAPGTEPVNPADLIAGLQQLVQAASAAHVTPLLGTLLPFAGALTWDVDNERSRAIVNQWIRTQRAAAVVDFESALQDPDAPLRLLPALDSGDHLHPNAAGLAAMAAAVNLSLLATAR